MVAVQMFTTDVILEYMFVDIKARFWAKVFYYLPQIILGILTSFAKSITPELFYLNQLFPYTQAVNFC